MKKPAKILLAVGGTGGHVFPAQVLGDKLLKDGHTLFFAGVHLKNNRYFDKSKYRYRSLHGATVFKKNPLQVVKALFSLLRGTLQSLILLRRLRPDCVVGFGSFHSFPPLLAAKLLGIDIVLFEPNLIPGKVTFLFSSVARATGIIFPPTAKRLQGNVVTVEMLHRPQKQKNPYTHFSLEQGPLTLLVFGGSQGAEAINCGFLAAIDTLVKAHASLQVIHLVGTSANVDEVKSLYASKQVVACVKEFESDMASAWRCADLVIARAGAGTIAEQIAYAVPGVLIPYPHAYAHQMANAQFMEHEVKGSLTVCQEKMQNLGSTIERALQERERMKRALISYKESHQASQLKDLICMSKKPFTS